MIEIAIANQQDALEVDKRWFRALARFVFLAEEVESATLSVALVNNATIHNVNRQFLGHDYPTDVITFSLSEPDEPLVGEVVLGGEYAIKQAEAIGWPAAVEAGLYLTHGILHLCGYDDHKSGDARAMKKRQESILRQFIAERLGQRYKGRPLSMVVNG